MSVCTCMYRFIAAALVCLACVCHSRRVQERVREDVADSFPEHQSSYSLAELSQSASPELKTVETLKSDFANILWREPHWNIFAKHFSLADHSSSSDFSLADLSLGGIIGIEAIKQFTKMLRQIYKKFSVKDFTVLFIEQNLIRSEWRNSRFKGERQQALDNDVHAHWSVELSEKTSPEVSIVIKAATTFRINRDNKVSFAKITACFVNGHQLTPMIWPTIGLEDTGSLDSIGEWIQRFSATYQQGIGETPVGTGDLPSGGSDISKAIATIKADFPKILRREPHWNNLADDAAVVDQIGTALVGVENIQVLLSLLRKLPSKFKITNLKVIYAEMVASLSMWKNGKLTGKVQEPITERMWEGGGSENVLQAVWRVNINTREWFWKFWKKSPTLTLQAKTFFMMDAEGKVDTVLVEDIVVNEWDVLAWPEVDLNDAEDHNIEFIDQWIEDIQLQITNPEEFMPYGDEGMQEDMLK